MGNTRCEMRVSFFCIRLLNIPSFGQGQTTAVRTVASTCLYLVFPHQKELGPSGGEGHILFKGAHPHIPIYPQRLSCPRPLPSCLFHAVPVLFHFLSDVFLYAFGAIYFLLPVSLFRHFPVFLHFRIVLSISYLCFVFVLRLILLLPHLCSRRGKFSISRFRWNNLNKITMPLRWNTS